MDNPAGAADGFFRIIVIAAFAMMFGLIALVLVDLVRTCVPMLREPDNAPSKPVLMF